MSTLDRRRDAPTLDLWRRNFATDPHFDGPNGRPTTKSITGKSYQGTSLDPLYVVQRLTQEFGPVGEGWGIEVDSEHLIDGEPYFDAKGNSIGCELLHTVRCRMWWRHPGQARKHWFTCCGGTPARYRTSRGRWVADEDVLKKSLTDALTKGASWLGIGADIHAGMWDSSKYVEERREDEQRRDAHDRAAEKIAVVEDALAKCEDAGAVRAYVEQPQFLKWLGVQQRNHPDIHEAVLALIEATKARFAATDGVPEEEPEEATPPPLYAYLSSADGLLEWPDLDRWRHEWFIRIAAVLRAKKTAKERFQTLDAMLERNRLAMRDLLGFDELHEAAVLSVTGRVNRAQTLLRQLDADSMERLNFDEEAVS